MNRAGHPRTAANNLSPVQRRSSRVDHPLQKLGHREQTAATRNTIRRTSQAGFATAESPSTRRDTSFNSAAIDLSPSDALHEASTTHPYPFHDREQMVASGNTKRDFRHFLWILLPDKRAIGDFCGYRLLDQLDPMVLTPPIT